MTGTAAPVLTPLDVLSNEISALESRLRAVDEAHYEPLRRAVEQLFRAGGKRVRPALVFAATRLSEPDHDKVHSLAAAVETLHAATLVHDDLIDGARLRRGQPTINTRWSAGATVLAGDWLFARAAGFAADTGSVPVMSIFARTLRTLTQGELQQMFERSEPLSIARYERRIYHKTAALFEAATEMSAVLAAQPEGVVRSLSYFGRELGMAFQIVDDILDFVGDESRTGKPVGSDLRAGTVTLPALLHFDAADVRWDGQSREERERLVAAVADDRQALDGAWAAAAERRDKAIGALEDLPRGEARTLLTGIARLAVERDA